MKIISRLQAIEERLPRYCTNEPCARGHLSERYVIGKACIACALENGRSRKRTRDTWKQKTYYKNWYTRNRQSFAAERSTNPQGHEYQPQQARIELRKHRALVHAIRSTSRRYAGVDRVSRTVRRLWAKVQKRQGECYAKIGGSAKLDYGIEHLGCLLKEAIRKGAVSATTKQPDSASVDQIVAGLGYHRANIQIVPLWWNYAKHVWETEALNAAIAKWQRARGSSVVSEA